MTTKSFKKTPKQIEAVRLMAKYIEVLLEGGSRSGKTFISIYAMLVRAAKYKGSKHLIVRKHSAHLNSIVFKTLPDVIKICFPTLQIKHNKKHCYFELDNGSQIWYGGTDDKERIEKLLGWEWDTIFINEASQLPFETYDLLKSRLNPMQGVKPLLLIDYNPPSKTHWGYVIFHLGLEYVSKQPHEGKNKERYVYIKMNPADNLENLSETYIDTLNSMSEKQRRRFLEGEYLDDSEFALWRREWIIANRINQLPETTTRVIVAVDPAVSGKSTSDDTGIVTVAAYNREGEEHYVVMRDDTIHGDISGWGKKVAEVYKEEKADCVVGEVNQGGDLVEMNIRNYDRHINYKSVRATRGKAKRAEPIADLYRRGLVHHFGEYPELEDQMCTWTEESDESPDNMDALVWGLSYLSGIGDIREIYVGTA